MAEVFDSLAVYGLSRDDEAVILATVLTGEPCLLIGAPGASKTRIGRSLAKALGVSFHSYNAACDQFEDIVGFLNMKSLGEGKVEYVSTPVTIWNKQMVSVEEINRPDPSTESKWLDFFAEGTMMGVPSGVKWRFATMNPLGTGGTRELGEATLGRFSAFVFVPDLADMSSGEQHHVLQTIADTNIPAFNYWTQEETKELIDPVDYDRAGELLEMVIQQAAGHFKILLDNSKGLDRFMVRLITSLAQGGKEAIRIDGRRAGLLRRLALAVRAVDLARANILRLEPRSLQDCVRIAIRAGLPIGVNEEGGRTKKSLAHIETVVSSLIAYLSDADNKTLEMQYELLTSQNVFRMAELLIQHRDKLDRIVQSAAWARIVKTHGFNGSLVGLMANQIEMVAPGTLPMDAMDGLTKLMNSGEIAPRYIRIPPIMKDYADRIRIILDQTEMVSKLIAANIVAEKAAEIANNRSGVSDGVIDALEKQVQQQIALAADFSKVVETILNKEPKVAVA